MSGLGESLGGAILIQAMAHSAVFKAVVAECSYSSFEAIAEERVGRVILRPLAWLAVKEGILYVDLICGVNLGDARPDWAIQNVHAPILLIHGEADNETSFENSVRLARANPQMTKLWLVPGAKHTGAYAEDPKVFESTVLDWFGERAATR